MYDAYSNMIEEKLYSLYAILEEYKKESNKLTSLLVLEINVGNCLYFDSGNKCSPIYDINNQEHIDKLNAIFIESIVTSALTSHKFDYEEMIFSANNEIEAYLDTHNLLQFMGSDDRANMLTLNNKYTQHAIDVLNYAIEDTIKEVIPTIINATPDIIDNGRTSLATYYVFNSVNVKVVNDTPTCHVTLRLMHAK